MCIRNRPLRAISGSARNAGEVNPGGLGAGQINITGDDTQTASGVLNLELGGTTAGSLYDQLVVTGKVTLDGTLNVRLLGAFVPAVSDFFRPPTFGSRIGVFATINGLDLGGGRLLDPLYTAGNLTLTVI